MTDERKPRAWADFWREGQDGGAGGCLTGAGDELGAAQATLWKDFGSSLCKGARIIDLGTGDGVVLRHMYQARKDLRLTGVDSALFLPPAPAKLRLRAGVAMEALPFDDGSFDAAVSQFGYEYGDTRAAAEEVARILVPGGRFLFLVHKLSGPIVAHNRDRAAALRWAAVDSGVMAKAKALAAARRSLPLPTPPGFRETLGDAARRFPGVPVAAEIAQAVLQALSMPPQASLAALTEIERKADGELTRLGALAEAARDEEGARALAAELREAGLEAEAPMAVINRSGLAFAWKLSGRS